MIIQALLKRPVENGGVLAVFLEEKGKLRNGAKPRITRNALTTFVVLGPKGLTWDLTGVSSSERCSFGR